MSYYSRSELRGKGEEIVEEAANATVREYDSEQKAARAKAAAEGTSIGPGGHQYSDEEIKNWVREQYNWVPDFFERQADPEPDGWDDIVASVDAVQGKFGGGNSSADPGLSFAAKAQAEIEEWEGHFSENLQNSVLIPFPTIADNQGKVATMLAETLGATVNLYRGWRRDNSGLADETIKALKDCGTKDGGDAKLGLSIVIAIAAITTAALAIPTGGGSLVLGAAVTAKVGLGLATVSSGAVIAGNFVPKEGPKLQLGAPTVSEVMSNMVTAHTDFYNKLLDEEEKITKALDANYEVLTSLRQLANAEGVVGPLTPMRPSIAGAENPSSGLGPE